MVLKNEHIIRIAHLNFIDSPGVVRKIKEEALAAQAAGLSIDYFIFSSTFCDRDEENLHYRYKPSRFGSTKLRFLIRFFLKEDLLESTIGSNTYDIYIIRFGKNFIDQGVTYRRWGSKIITEHHSDEIAELLLKKSIGRLALAEISRRRSVKALRKVAGIIAMTDELKNIELCKAGAKPALVIANGIDVPITQPILRNLKKHDPIKFIFAASNFQEWQGLDLLVQGIHRYSGSRKIELHLAGNLDQKQRSDIVPLVANGRVIYHGLLAVDDLRELYRTCHIGLAGFGFHRIGVNEACPLKVREYAAWGLPFIYTHKDTDFPDGIPWALKLPGGEKVVDVDAMINFSEKVYSEGNPSLELWHFAKNNLDWTIKIKQMYYFALDIAKKKSGESDT